MRPTLGERTTIRAGARKCGWGLQLPWGDASRQPSSRRAGRQQVRKRFVSTSLGVLAAHMAGAVCAQEAPAPAAASEDTPTQVVITGSRIARSSENAPSPVTTVGADELQKI